MPQYATDNIGQHNSGSFEIMKKKTKFSDIVENTQGLIDKSLLLHWEDESE